MSCGGSTLWILRARIISALGGCAWRLSSPFYSCSAA